MSGHSKWSTIKHKKAAKDAKRGKIFTKLIKEITVAARMGGGDINANPRLRTAVLAARPPSMPNDNIDRAIKKGTGELEGVTYEEVSTRATARAASRSWCASSPTTATAPSPRSATSSTSDGGNLGETGCVGWMFQKKGVHHRRQAARIDEDRLMEVALEAGADDIARRPARSSRSRPRPRRFEAVTSALEKAGIAIATAEVTMVPQNTVRGRRRRRRADAEAARGARGSRRRAEGVGERRHLDEEEVERLSA